MTRIFNDSEIIPDPNDTAECPSPPPYPPSPPPYPPTLPPSPASPPPDEEESSTSTSHATTSGDPHLHLAHGGVADFRGRNDTYYALLSAPGVHFAAKTTDTDFLLPRPQLVHGSFFTAVAWVVRGVSGTVYGVASDANRVGVRVTNLQTGRLVADKEGVWQEWWEDGVRAYYKQSTVYVRANGWEVNATRHPIYNRIAGPSPWRFDLAMRPLDKTGFENAHGASSKTCYPHGIVGQSWDGDALAVDGATDDYAFDPKNPVITTKAMAEGAIEGRAIAYELPTAFLTEFAFSRFDKDKNASCSPRKIASLAKRAAVSTLRHAVGSDDGEQSSESAGVDRHDKTFTKEGRGQRRGHVVRRRKVVAAMVGGWLALGA